MHSWFNPDDDNMEDSLCHAIQFRHYPATMTCQMGPRRFGKGSGRNETNQIAEAG